MTVIRSAIATLGAAAATVAGAVLGFVLPESAEEASILAGMALLALWALVDPGIPDSAALLIPGLVYLLTGLGFTLRRGR